MAAKLVSLNLADNVLFAGGGAPIRDGTSNTFLIQDGTSNTVVFSAFGQGGHATDALAQLQASMTDHGTQSGHSLDLTGLHPGDLHLNDFLFR